MKNYCDRIANETGRTCAVRFEFKVWSEYFFYYTTEPNFCQMKKCSKNCPAICDYCHFYEFSGDENGAYTGDGCCIALGESREPESICDLFVCFNYVKERLQNELVR